MSNKDGREMSANFKLELSTELTSRCAVTLGQIYDALPIDLNPPENFSATQYADYLIELLNLMDKVKSPLQRGEVRTYNQGRLSLIGLVQDNASWRLGTDGMAYAKTPDGLIRLDVANLSTGHGFILGYRTSAGPKEALADVEGDLLSRVRSPKGAFMPLSEANDLTDVISSTIELRRKSAPENTTPKM